MVDDVMTTPESFNRELRQWVKRLTGKSIGDIGWMRKATAYRNTQDGNLLVPADLANLVRRCAELTVDEADQADWIRSELATWRTKWAAAEAELRSRHSPEAESRSTTDGSKSPPRHSETPWSHRSDRLQLPRALAAPTLTADGGKPAEPLASLLDAWLPDVGSNLFFISGPSGFGKSTEAKLWLAEHPGTKYVSLLDGPISATLSGTQPATMPVVIDDFDPIPTRADEGGVRPDLSQLRVFFGQGGRCVILSKRNPAVDLDELAEQLRSVSRLDGLGVHSPTVVRVLPLSYEELSQWAEVRQDARLKKIAAVVTRSAGQQLASPMIVRQLYESADESRPAPRTQFDAYTAHLNHVCGSAWDRGSSRIPGRVRFLAYRDLAWDIFAGLGSSGARRRLAISSPRVAERIQEQLQRDLATTRQRDFLTYEWTADFLSLTEIFSVTGGADSETASFTHSSYYEFFAAEAIRARLINERGLALDEAQFAEATMDSLIVSFVKAGIQEDDYDAIAALCSRDRLSWLDRMLCLYLMEERPGFKTLLSKSPEDYWTNLQRAAELFSSLFLRKATMYQQVIAGRASAWDYVELLKREEGADAETLERSLLGSSAELTASLLARLTNPELAAALPISIYRLGQMGDDSAIADLRRVSRKSTELKQASAEAIRQIQERQDRGH